MLVWCSVPSDAGMFDRDFKGEAPSPPDSKMAIASAATAAAISIPPPVGSFYNESHLAECAAAARYMNENHAMFAARHEKEREAKVLEEVERETKLEMKREAEKKRDMLSTWQKTLNDMDLPEFVGPDESFKPRRLDPGPPTARELFHKFFTLNLIDHLVRCTNANGYLKAEYKECWVDTDRHEMCAVLGILILMASSLVCLITRITRTLHLFTPHLLATSIRVALYFVLYFVDRWLILVLLMCCISEAKHQTLLEH